MCKNPRSLLLYMPASGVHVLEATYITLHSDMHTIFYQTIHNCISHFLYTIHINGSRIQELRPRLYLKRCHMGPFIFYKIHFIEIKNFKWVTLLFNLFQYYCVVLISLSPLFQISSAEYHLQRSTLMRRLQFDRKSGYDNSNISATHVCFVGYFI